MTKKQEKLWLLINFFDKLTKKHSIEYALDKMTLLESLRLSTFSPKTNNFYVFLDIVNFKKLHYLFPNYILSSFNRLDYKHWDAIFTFDAAKFKKADQPHINIRLCIPTSIKRLELFTNTFTSLFFRLIYKFPNSISAFDYLYAKKYQGFFFLENKYFVSKLNWALNVSKKYIYVPFNDLSLPIVSNSEELLNYWYGNDWLVSDKFW
ncbi:MAG: hypothetical protein E7Y34_00075 [Mycoplasma sp.]|nr:hypothetical protein [Mycoplasma sp.]